MANPTYSSQAFKAAATPFNSRFLSELFAATPLYIFATALQAALQKAKR